jgi:hypothetical protein
VARAGGTFSPKNTTSGLSTPPHAAQSTIANDSISPAGSTASPSGLINADDTVHCGLAARSRSFSSGRGVRSPQDRQVTRCRLPCSSVTSVDPAAWCSPSTFCVMIPASSPSCSSVATARCPAFGVAAAMCRHPTWLRAQYRRRAASAPVNVW